MRTEVSSPRITDSSQARALTLLGEPLEARKEAHHAGNGLPEFEYVSLAELIEELLEFNTISPGIERRLRDELGPGRFSRLKKLLFQVWQTDRMI